MWALLIVPAQPPRQVDNPGIRRGEWDCIGPLPQKRLDEALGLAIGLGRVRPGADMPDSKHPQRLAKQPRDVT